MEELRVNITDFKVNQDDRTINIKCSISDYLNRGVDDYIKTAIRMQPAKIIVEIDSREEIK